MGLPRTASGCVLTDGEDFKCAGDLIKDIAGSGVLSLKILLLGSGVEMGLFIEDFSPNKFALDEAGVC